MSARTNYDLPYQPAPFPAQMYELMGQPEAGVRCIEIFTETNYDWPGLPAPLPTQMSELWELREAGVQCMNAGPEPEIEPSQIGDWMNRAMAKGRRITADLRVLDTALPYLPT